MKTNSCLHTLNNDGHLQENFGPSYLLHMLETLDVLHITQASIKSTGPTHAK